MAPRAGRIQPQIFHRLALAVEDAGSAEAWYRRVFGAAPIIGMNAPRADTGAEGDEDLEGADTRMLWHGGYPLILLSKGVPGGPVAGFLARYGPGVHSLAWEIEDLWAAEHFLRARDIGITGVNVSGRHFFMHPRDTHRVLMEWTDDRIAGDPRRSATEPTGEGGGVLDGAALAWVTAVVADAARAADLILELAECSVLDGNPRGPDGDEITRDLRVGDLTVRLVTPRSSASPYAAVLERGARLYSYALRVANLEDAIKSLDAEGIRTALNRGHAALLDPRTTLGLPIEIVE